MEEMAQRVKEYE